MADKTRYKILDNIKDLNRLIKACKETGYASVDFETTGTELFRKDFIPTILSVTFQAGSSIIIPLAHEESPFKHKWLKVLTKFGREVIENEGIVKIGWNWKFDWKIFRKYGIYYRGTIIDGMLAKYLLNEERPSGLKEMVTRYLPKYSGYQTIKGFDKIPWNKKPFIPLCEYAAIDTDATFQLGIFFESKLIQQPKLYSLYRNLIMPASRVLGTAEYSGLNFNRKLNLDLHEKYEKLIKDQVNKMLNLRKVKRYSVKAKKEKLDAYIDEIEQEISSLKADKSKDNSRMIKTRENKIMKLLSGEFTTKKEQELIADFNFGSVKQLIDLLYLSEHGFKFPVIDKTEKGSPATGEDAVKKIEEFDKTGFIKDLLEYRSLTHAYSSFIKGYRDLIQEDEKIHGSFNIHSTVTGRLSSKEPNLQQIPKKEVNPDIKPQFTAPKGQLYLIHDFSQAELRVLAYMAKDKNMIQWFNEGKDIHVSSACIKYQADYNEALEILSDERHPNYVEWKNRRKNAKITNFGAVYGVTAFKLKEQLSTKDNQVTEEEAQEFLDNFFVTFPGVKRFMDRQIKKMEKNGWVESLYGRKRRCPDIYSEQYFKYLEATRQSYNAPVQATASDYTLMGSIILYWLVKTGQLPYIREVSTVHDSVYNYTFPEFINPWTLYQIQMIYKNPMTKKYFGFEIKEPQMKVDFGIGRTMDEELPFIPGYDYRKMLEPNFSLDDYYNEHKKVKDVNIEDYPKAFPEYFTKQYVNKFRRQWQRKFNQHPQLTK